MAYIGPSGLLNEILKYYYWKKTKECNIANDAFLLMGQEKLKTALSIPSNIHERKVLLTAVSYSRDHHI